MIKKQTNELVRNGEGEKRMPNQELPIYKSDIFIGDKRLITHSKICTFTLNAPH